MRRLSAVLLDYVRQVGWFLLASTGVAALATFLLPFAGYATYGDRPGPGWYGPPSGITWAGALELAEFALVLPAFGAVGAAMYFVVPYAAVRVLERTRLPRYAIRALGALLCAAVAWVVLAGAGWYISLGWVAGGAGVAGGAVYGARGLPRAATAAGDGRGSPVT